MRKLRKQSIHTRVVILVSIIAAAMALTAVSSELLVRRQAEDLSRHVQKERSSFYANLLDLRSARMTAIVSDYTYWDDMVEFVKKPNPTWESENLDSTLGTYDIDILWVFSPNMKQIYSVSDKRTLDMKTVQLPPAARQTIMHSGPYYHFFLHTSDGLLELRGGSIHPSYDVKHTGPSDGYFFVGRIWDSAYLKDIQEMTGSQRAVVHYEPILDIDSAHTEYAREFPTWDGSRVATLLLENTDPVTELLEKSSDKFMVVMVVFAFVLLTVISSCLYRWVSRPLGVLSRAMSTQSSHAAAELANDRAEMGELAALMADFFIQKQELKTAYDMLEVRIAERTQQLAESNKKLSAACQATIEGWSRALDMRDHETVGHSKRVTEMTLMLAREFGLSEADILNVERGALLHDIGKMAVPDKILQKNGPLTDAEWEVMRRHPQNALDMLEPIAFLRPSLDIPYCHHEKWDGTGYPRGLKCDNIPFAARIFAVADVWDALVSDRPYKPGWDVSEVRAHVKSLAGSHFDPEVVEKLLALTEYMEDSRPLSKAA